MRACSAPKSFIGNTYGPARKCCKQKTYNKPNFFRCNTYKKQGVRAGQVSYAAFWNLILAV
jgi:hypothetical protein